MAERRRHGLESLLDVVVYAPIGAFFHGPEMISEMAERGRSQVANAKVIGKLAVQRGRSEAASVQETAKDRITDALTAVARAAGAPLAGAPEATDAPVRSTPDDAVDAEAPPSDATPGLRVVPESVPSVDELPIPGYDTLSASQVVPRLDSLGHDELVAVRDYEQAHRGRMTILSRIAQLEAS
jgi:hypothetical protein